MGGACPHGAVAACLHNAAVAAGVLPMYIVQQCAFMRDYPPTWYAKVSVAQKPTAHTSAALWGMESPPFRHWTGLL